MSAQGLAALAKATAISAALGLAGGALSILVEYLANPLTPRTWWLGPLDHTLGPWAALTVAVGHGFRDRRLTAAWAGMVTQAGLVIGYYASRAQQYDFISWRDTLIPGMQEYLPWAVVIGPIFGLAGTALKDPRQHIRIPCLSLAAAPWIVDGVQNLMAAWAGVTETASVAGAGVLSIAIGLAVPWLVTRSWRDLLLSLLPASVVCAGYLVMRLVV